MRLSGRWWEQPERHEEQPNRAFLWITIVAALPVLYVLSIGPVLWVVEKQLKMAAPRVWFEIFYYPLGRLADHWPAFNSALTVYFYLWGFGE